MQQRVTIKPGLLDASHRNKAKTIVKRVFRDSTLFEDIIECPVRHHLHQAIALRNVIAQRGSNVNTVAGAEVTVRRHIPLGPEQRQLRMSGSLDLVLDLPDGMTDTLVHRNLLVGVEEIIDGVIAVSVTGDEVDGHLLLRDVKEERLDP